MHNNSTTTPIKNYTDMLVVETLIGNKNILKTAQQADDVMSGVASKVQGYVDNNIDPNDKVGSVLYMIAPGLVFATLRSFGLGFVFSSLLSLAMRVFHIDVAGILRSIWDSLKSSLSGDKKMTSDQVHNIVQSAVQENVGSDVEENKSNETPVATVANQLRTAKIFRIALEAYQDNGLFSIAAIGKKQTVSFLSSILSFIFRVILGSAGLMVAGDLINHYLNRPNAIDNPIRGGKPVGNGPQDAPTPAIQQKRFPLNPSLSNPVRNSSNLNWIEDVTNNPASISQMLQNFAKEVYQGLDGHEATIQSSPYFQNLVETISWYNHESPGSSTVFIPRMFTTKKNLVDQFINDVAEKTPATPQTGDMTAYKV